MYMDEYKFELIPIRTEAAKFIESRCGNTAVSGCSGRRPDAVSISSVPGISLAKTGRQARQNQIFPDSPAIDVCIDHDFDT
jgi:hypothetical protein